MTSLGIGKGGQHTRTVESVPELTGCFGCGGHAELVVEPFGQPQTLSVPRIRLSHPPSRALHPKMLLGAFSHPFELSDDLLDGWLTVSGTEQLLEDPGVAERAACQQHGRDAGVFVGPACGF